MDGSALRRVEEREEDRRAGGRKKLSEATEISLD